MSIFKRGKVYWYHFVFSGEHIQESTKQGNPRVARQIEAAHKTALAKGEAGFREKKRFRHSQTSAVSGLNLGHARCSSGPHERPGSGIALVYVPYTATCLSLVCG